MKRYFYIYLAIFLISCSVLIFEMTLLKFFAVKLLGAWPFLVISMAFLGIGASGTYLYLRKEAGKLSPDYSLLSRFSGSYAVSIPLSIIIFALLPFSPPQPGLSVVWGGLSYHAVFLSMIYMLLFAFPFFLSGVCISYVLSLKETNAGRVLFFDLLGAGIGAIGAVLLLGGLGGYGMIALSAIFAFGGSLIFLKEAIKKESQKKIKIFLLYLLPFAVLFSGLLVYPSAMVNLYKFDIIAPKSLEGEFKLFQSDFNGLGATYWNQIARIDLSKEGESGADGYLFGLSSEYRNKKYVGRYILVDSGCITRQFRLGNSEKDNEFLGHFLFSIPYQLRQNTENVLVVGAGGGVDILIGKYFNAKNIDVVEINSATVDILKGNNKNDPLNGTYAAFTASDDQTAVNFYNAEGRSFLSGKNSKKYDVLQLTGVDLLTALKSGGLVLSENYLYTQEALGYYYDALNEGGYVQITYWNGPHALRLFVTALAMLEERGIKEGHTSLAVITDKKDWTNIIIKKGSFSGEEAQRLRSLAEENDFDILFDQSIRREYLEQIRQVDEGIRENVQITYRPDEKGSYFLSSVNEKEFAGAANLQKLPFNLTPTHDDKPFFYSIYKKPADDDTYDPAEIYAEAAKDRVSQALMLVGTMLALTLILLPLFLKRSASKELKRIPLPLSLIFFFGTIGVAFSLIEVALIQKFSIFVGGPFYSMGVTLPAILIFYSLGAFTTFKLSLSRFRLLTLSVGGIILYSFFGYLFFDEIIKSLFNLPDIWRIALTVLMTAPVGFFLGFPAPLVLEIVKNKIDKTVVPVMWGANSCGNVVGALVFASISQITGFNLLLLFSSLLYLTALIFFMIWQK